eukprot:m.243280 g.243280  ORF g.243280 m.243280 type:complete len:181 (+) comp17461_c0_seq3:4140-4682(+)
MAPAPGLGSIQTTSNLCLPTLNWIQTCCQWRRAPMQPMLLMDTRLLLNCTKRALRLSKAKPRPNPKQSVEQVHQLNVLNASCDEFLHDLVAATINALYTSVYKGSGDRVFEHVTPTTVELYTYVSRLVLKLSAPVFGHARHLLCQTLLLMKLDTLIHKGSRNTDGCLHFRKRVSNGLEVT